MSIRKNSRKKKRPPCDAAIDQAIGDMLDRHCIIASDHVDAITVIASRVKPDGTTSTFAVGRGSRHARINSVVEWLDLVS